MAYVICSAGSLSLTFHKIPIIKKSPRQSALVISTFNRKEVYKMGKQFYEKAFAFGLRSVGWLLVATAFALYLAADGATRLADAAGRQAARAEGH